MPGSRPVHLLRLRILACVGGLAVAPSIVGCGTEAPVPQPMPVATPATPSSTLKFDVGAMPEPPAAIDPELTEQLRERLASPAAAGVPLQSWETVRRFYEQRGDRLAWIQGRQISAAGVDALRGLAQLPPHGLDPSRYGTDALAPRGTEPDDPVGFDLLLTDAWLTAATHLAKGRVAPGILRRRWTADGRADALVSVLETAVIEGNPQEALLAQAPPDPEYVARVRALEALLARGKAGLSKADQRLRAQLGADLERIRWLPREPGPRYLRIDQGAGRLVLVEDSKAALSMAVVGSARCRLIDDRSTTLARVELDPENAAYGRYALHGADGDDRGALVLHGGPADQPFMEGEKPRSGCLRLQDPSALVAALLRGKGGPPSPTADGKGPPQVVELTPPVPLLLTRTTVDIGPKGGLRLREEIPSDDESLRDLLDGGPPRVRRLPAPPP